MAQRNETPDADWRQQAEALRAERDAALAREAALVEALRERTTELAARNSAYSERIEHQSATIDVLKAMSASPGDPQPVFKLIAMRARELCNGAGISLFEYDGALVYHRAITPGEASDAAMAAYDALFPMRPTRGSITCRAILDRRIVHVRDIRTEDVLPAVVGFGYLSQLTIPLLRDGAVIGAITLTGQEAGGFSDTQVELLQTFAEQAMIAITSAETYRALQTRTIDLRESLDYQTATSDVLAVISRSTFDLQPVLDTVARTAARLCRAEMATIAQREGEALRVRANFGFPPEYEAYQRSRGAFPLEPNAVSVGQRCVIQGDVVHVDDAAAVPNYPEALVRLGNQRTSLGVPLMLEGRAIGNIVLARQRVEPFTDQQIALVRTFADQAVIAIENTRLITEQREALEQQTATAEVLGVINANPGELEPVFDAILAHAYRVCDLSSGSLELWDGTRFRAVATRNISPELAARVRGGYVPGPNSATRRLIEGAALVHIPDLAEIDDPGAQAAVTLGGVRTLLTVALRRENILLGHIIAIRQEVRPFSDKQIALLQNFAAQAVIAMENARLLNEIRAARDAAETALADLRRTQDRLVQTEKMASLGQLTAGIAHEIKNPLNFVNNFADLSVDLIAELNEAVAPEKLTIAADLRAEIDELTATLTGNLQKIVEHGRRADSIVKNMLLHSRTGASERRAVDLNAIAEEALNLAYHGARAETPGFNITMQKDLDPSIGAMEIYPQEIARVLVNLINNGFYAAHKRAGQSPGFEPALRLSTKNLGDRVEIRVRDNGTGIPVELRAKIFEPFFTTKPAGEGTGLGLSLSHDIVVKQHGGTIAVESEPEIFTEFVITIPRAGGPA